MNGTDYLYTQRYTTYAERSSVKGMLETWKLDRLNSHSTCVSAALSAATGGRESLTSYAEVNKFKSISNASLDKVNLINIASAVLGIGLAP